MSEKKNLLKKTVISILTELTYNRFCKYNVLWIFRLITDNTTAPREICFCGSSHNSYQGKCLSKYSKRESLKNLTPFI